MYFNLKNGKGFTLPELLIVLIVLGVIAAYSIPKILQTPQQEKYNVQAKEWMATLSAAYQARVFQGTTDWTLTRPSDFLSRLNYTKIENSSVSIDDTDGTSLNCDTNYNSAGHSSMCIRLHSGAILMGVSRPACHDDHASNYMMRWLLDPDGIAKGDANSSLVIGIYYNGLVRTSATLLPNTIVYCNSFSGPSNNPSWYRD